MLVRNVYSWGCWSRGGTWLKRGYDIRFFVLLQDDFHGVVFFSVLLFSLVLDHLLVVVDLVLELGHPSRADLEQVACRERLLGACSRGSKSDGALGVFLLARVLDGEVDAALQVGGGVVQELGDRGVVVLVDRVLPDERVELGPVDFVFVDQVLVLLADRAVSFVVLQLFLGQLASLPRAGPSLAVRSSGCRSARWGLGSTWWAGAGTRSAFLCLALLLLG